MVEPVDALAPLLHLKDRTQVFFDGPSIYAILKKLNLKMDYKLFREYLESRCRLVRLSYFTTVRDPENPENQTIISILNFLEKNGYTVEAKRAREAVSPDTGYVRIKGSMMAEMTLAMYMAAAKTDHMILFTGDGDHVATIEAVKKTGTKVTLVSAEGYGISGAEFDDLARVADNVVYLDELSDEFLAPFETGSFSRAGSRA